MGSTDLSLQLELAAEARALAINASQTAKSGVETSVAARRVELWLAENAAAIESSNSYVELHGLPLSRFRNF